MYKVLLVDDEPATMDTERRAIEQRLQDFRVVGEAYSVDEAIQLYEKLQPDVVLTDIKMPKRDGTELIADVMNREKCGTLCIAVSGYEDFNYVHDAFLNGAFDYLLKPVNPRKLMDLFERIREVLDSTRKKEGDQAQSGKKSGGDVLAEEIESYLRKNLKGDNSIFTICKIFSISQPYLSKVFKQHYSCTYNEYLMSLKIEEAKKLLEETESEYRIGEIAELSGFSDQFYFSKAFKNATGFSPREYRNQIGNRQ